MRCPTTAHGSALPCPALFVALGRAYAEFLQAHEHACAFGQPLLTEAGISYLRQRLLLAGVSRTVQAGNPRGPEALPGNYLLPSWDAAGRRLWLGEQLIKEFRQPAPNQTTLLDVFQEQGWARAHIDDPLPLTQGEDEQDARRRLHETIKNLNRGLLLGTLRFRGDGTGQGVIWEYDRSLDAPVEPEASAKGPAPALTLRARTSQPG